MSNMRIQISNDLFDPAASEHFEGTYQPEVMKAGPDLYSFSKPLSWQADISNTGEALLVTGIVEGDATTSCARCLESVEFSLVGDIEGYFLFSAEGRDEDDESFDCDVLPQDKVIDLEPMIKAALLVDIPLVPLCSDDCRGICIQCGANLNDGDCGCEPDDSFEQEKQAAHPLAALKDFEVEE